MKSKTNKYLVLTLIITFLASSCGHLKPNSISLPFNPITENKVFPKPIGYINDFENIFTDKEKKELTNIIKQFEKETTIQIAVVIVGSILPYEDMNEYGRDLGNYWRVGKEVKNNGIVIVFGKVLKEIRISNGYGIESRITNSETKIIIDDIIVPEFKKENYFQGIQKGLRAIFKKLNNSVKK